MALGIEGKVNMRGNIETGRWLATIVIALALLSFCVVVGCGCSPDKPVPGSGDPAGAAVATAGPEDTKTVKDIRSASEFDAFVLKSPVPVLVDFWATWCPPCREQAPIVERLAEKSGGAYRVVKLDVDRVRAIPTRYEVPGYPTLIVFAGGKEKKRFVGLTYEPDLARALDAAKGS